MTGDPLSLIRYHSFFLLNHIVNKEWINSPQWFRWLIHWLFLTNFGGYPSFYHEGQSLIYLCLNLTAGMRKNIMMIQRNYGLNFEFIRIEEVKIQLGN